jgi:hypothetical protein
MKKSFLLISLLIPYLIFCQDLGLIQGIGARHFQLKKTKDTIDFLLVNGNTDSIKPVIVFCQGSNPIPLIIKMTNEMKFVTFLSNFNYKKIAKEYHIILISMPNTPIEVDQKKLNKQFCYVTDTSLQQSYSLSYLANNFEENYIRRTKEVIDFLYVQKWVDPKKIILFGHSQGSKIAVGAALNNNKIAKVGYAGGNPLGRIDQLIREQRKLAKTGKITPEESQQQIESIYEMWRQINKAPTAITTEFGDPNKTWVSFSRPLLDDLLNLKKPLYVAYGTEDITSAFCDLLPIYFIKEQKSNLTLKPYIGLEHNFFEIDSLGKPVYTKGHWEDVIQGFIKWLKQ